MNEPGPVAGAPVAGSSDARHPTTPVRSPAPLFVAAGDAITDTADGVEVRHIVGRSIMHRELRVSAGSVLHIAEPATEHILTVVVGEVVAVIDRRTYRLGVGDALLLLGGPAVTVQAGDQEDARCHLVSSPPDARLLHHLLHLEHEDHGFD